jgi:predicted transposase YdaD
VSKSGAILEQKKSEGFAEGKAEGLAEGIEKGKAEGKAEGLAEIEKEKAEALAEGNKNALLHIAKQMIDQGFNVEMVRKITGLSEEDVLLHKANSLT